MRRIYHASFVCALSASLSVFSVFAGCALDQRDEIIGGITLPIPGGMSRAEDQTIELTVPGFEGGQAVYRGSVAPKEIVGFYKEEMAARGWKPNASLVIQGGYLAYSKDDKSVLITVGKSGRDTSLAILVGTTALENNP